MIKLSNLNKSFTTPTHVIRALDNVSLSVEAGEIFGIIGKSGAGKSSLLRCINLLDRPDSGTIEVDGVRLDQLSQSELLTARHTIGMIFQHFNLLSAKTVYDNVALPLRFQKINEKIIAEKILPLLEIVELSDKKNAYPSQLSGGQKQRVAIARALASHPNVLLCDEATSALDPQTTEAVLNLLQKINQQFNLTIVLITHEMEVVKSICDRIAIMADGKVIEHGKSFDIFTHPQAEITQTLVKACIEPTLPNSIKQRLSTTPSNHSHPLIKIHFFGEAAQQAVIAEVIAETQIKASILQANMEYIQDQAIGVAIIEILASPDKLDDIVRSLAAKQITAEVLGYV